jgi:hypothetical protein
LILGLRWARQTASQTFRLWMSKQQN